MLRSKNLHCRQGVKLISVLINLLKIVDIVIIKDIIETMLRNNTVLLSDSLM